MPKGEALVGGKKVTRQSLAKASLEVIADGMSTVPTNSNAFAIFEAELRRREAEAIIDAAKAQKRTAFLPCCR